MVPCGQECTAGEVWRCWDTAEVHSDLTTESQLNLTESCLRVPRVPLVCAVTVTEVTLRGGLPVLRVKVVLSQTV